MLRTILLVEDDADAREIFGAALRAAGYRTISAVHGAEGVHLARRHRPSLILMDIRMPVMDGREAVRYLKSDPQTAGVPIWGVSAYLDEEDGADGFFQFDNVVAKPIEPPDLVAMVDAYLGPPHPFPLS